MWYVVAGALIGFALDAAGWYHGEGIILISAILMYFGFSSRLKRLENNVNMLEGNIDMLEDTVDMLKDNIDALIDNVDILRDNYDRLKKDDKDND